MFPTRRALYVVCVLLTLLLGSSCQSEREAALDGVDGDGGTGEGGALSDGGLDAFTYGGEAGIDGKEGGVAPPKTTSPALLLNDTALYPRVIRLNVGARAGTLLASVITPLPSGHLGGAILASHDDGFSFAAIGHIDDPIMKSGLCCSTLYELPRALGALPAGTLLWAASIGGDTSAQPMSLVAWSSPDGGATWTRLTTIVTGSAPRSAGGIWEPEFSLLASDVLVCHYSDETESGHSQTLVEQRSTDGIHFDSRTDTVALASPGARPGMANVRMLPNGTFVMTYEICGVAGDNCTAHLRTSNDGWNWGDATSAGARPATVDGMHFAHAPTLVWSTKPGGNGRLYLVGQMVYDGAGNVAPENGSVIFANSERGSQNWWELPAPVPVKAPYDNYCPNYSSSIAALDDGLIGLEVATQWDGSVCRAYFARGLLGGTGGAEGVKSGDRYRLVNVMSGMCLDVSGGSTKAGATIEQWTCNDLAPQNWTFTETAKGSFSMTAQNSGLCLAVSGAAAPGSAVEQQACDGSAGQAWTLQNVGRDYYVLRHGAASLCMDDAAGSTTAGTAMQLWTCNDLSPQIWHLEAQ